jgi:hypothetical protein
MIKKISILTIMFLFIFFNNTQYAAACSGSGQCPKGDVCVESKCVTPTDVAKICGLETIFANVVTIFGAIIGFAFFAMMVWGGMRYLLSGGDPKALQAAKGTITWAILGLAFFALSYTILLLLKAYTGVDVGTFKVCGY